MTANDCDWVERNTGHTLTPEERRCVDVICQIARPYNLRLRGNGWQDWTTNGCATKNHTVWFGGTQIMLLTRERMSTWDDNSLTRVVLAAHRERVRFDISAGPGMGIVRLQFTARLATADRDPAGMGWDFHPSLGEAVAVFNGQRMSAEAAAGIDDLAETLRNRETAPPGTRLTPSHDSPVSGV